MHVLAPLAPDEIDAGDDVSPLVGPPDLDRAVEVVVQPEVVVGLQEHVAELGEGDAVLGVDALLDALPGQHLVHRDVLADVAEELEHRDGLRPLPVVDERTRSVGAPGVEVDDPSELFLDPRDVVVQRVLVEQVAFVGPTGGVPDHARGATGECDGPVTGVLEPPQHDQPDEVADVEAVGGGIAPVVDPDRSRGHRLAERLAVGGVVDEVALLQVGDQIAGLATGRWCVVVLHGPAKGTVGP